MSVASESVYNNSLSSEMGMILIKNNFDLNDFDLKSIYSRMNLPS